MASKKIKISLSVLTAVTIILLLGAVLERQKIERFMLVQSLFSGADQVEHFRTIAHSFPVHVIAAPAHPLAFEAGTPLTLPVSFVYQGKTRNTAEFLNQTDTTGLLVLKDAQLVYENYWRGNDVNTHWISFSLCKSFISALVGIAVSDGAIHSIDDPVTNYVPELRGSAYDRVRIKDILQMSSGASWNEDYSDWNSDINRFGRAFAFGGSFDDFVRTLKREHTPGTFNRYNSMDTQVLGLLLRHVTGRPVSEYLAEKLWLPLGMESGAEWMTDDAGSEFAAGGLNATLRDYARLGELYRNNGNWHGRQIVDANWVHASITPDAPHLQPGTRKNADSSFGYGLQWWVPDNRGEFTGIGIYNQFIYVSANRHLVIAKTSANHNYGTSNGESSDHEEEHMALFKAIEAAAEKLN